NGTVITNRFGVGYPDMDYYEVIHYGGSRNILFRDVMNPILVRPIPHLDGEHTTAAEKLAWRITAANSLMPANESLRNQTHVMPYGSFRQTWVGIQAENECGCSPWKKTFFSVVDLKDTTTPVF
ncbi:MAG: hypothetical protein Q4G08_09580, partial [Capnocytophaga sp.]|nr:hypothetical protein [Capnocytophaga sp.]